MMDTNPTIRVLPSKEPPSDPPRPKALSRNKRHSEQLSGFRAASPVTTGSHDNHLYLALPSASSRSHLRALSAASLYNENGAGVDEKLLINDILGIESLHNTDNFLEKRSHSEVQLSEAAPMFRLEASSRSLSTWVAVGDTSATTQLPSPQARTGSATPNFTPADLVRSVNKRLRQTYLKKRLMTTYKALEKMNESGFNIEKLKDVVHEGELASHPELVSLLGITPKMMQKKEANSIPQLGSAAATVKAEAPRKLASSAKTTTLSSREIALDRGKPLSRYDRNVMIFDWLYSLDETATIDVT